jgi:hypothetical protein
MRQCRVVVMVYFNSVRGHGGNIAKEYFIHIYLRNPLFNKNNEHPIKIRTQF